jgi:hypothetical protein
LHTIRAAFAAEQPAHSQAPRQARRLVTAAGGPQRRVRLLQRFRENLTARKLVVLPVVRDLLLGPDARQHIGEFLPHAAGVVEVGPVRGQLVGITGPAEADVYAPMAQNIGVAMRAATCSGWWIGASTTPMPRRIVLVR